MLDTLLEVVEGMEPAVELPALWIKEVCITPPCVALTLVIVSVLTPVGSTERLNVIPNAAVLEVVPLTQTGKPALGLTDGCIGDNLFEFAPKPSLLDGRRDSLAGIHISDLVEVNIVDRVLDTRLLV